MACRYCQLALWHCFHTVLAGGMWHDIVRVYGVTPWRACSEGIIIPCTALCGIIDALLAGLNGACGGAAGSSEEVFVRMSWLAGGSGMGVGCAVLGYGGPGGALMQV